MTGGIFKVILCNILISVACVSGYDLNKLHEDITAIADCHNSTNHGLSVSIVKDGQTIFAEGYGVKDAITRRRVTNTTLFGIASLSKAFAATLIVKLLDNSKYSIHTPVKDILGEDFQFVDDLRTKYATLEDLLSHRMGLSPNNWIRLDSNLTRHNLLGRVKYLEASGTFRGSFVYSNLMYGVLTTIAEILGGKSWEDLITNEIYKPVGMHDSAFATTIDFLTSNVALPYHSFLNKSVNEVPIELSRRWGLLCGSGCVMSSAVDMANWMLFHLSKGKNMNGKQIMDKKKVEDMGKPRNVAMGSGYFNTQIFPKITYRYNYGLGWFIGHYDGIPIQFHSGSTHGYSAFVTLYPDYKLGIYTALNGGDYGYKLRLSLHNYITDIILDRQPWLTPSTICSFPSPWINETSSSNNYEFITPSLKLSSYAGVYINKLYGNLEIYVNESTNQLQAIYGIGRYSLKRYAFDSQTTEYYYGTGEGTVVQIDKKPFIFDMKLKDNLVPSVSVRGFDRANPPKFTRQCKESKTSSIHPLTGNRLLIITCLSMIIILITVNSPL